jgi:hypothetical protein
VTRTVGVFIVAALAAACAPSSSDPKPAVPAARTAAQPLRFSMEWVAATNGGVASVEVRGLDSALLRRLEQPDMTAERWARVLAVFAESSEATPSSPLPAMLGAHSVAGGVVRFTPRFPLEPGVRYRAVFNPSALAGQRAKRAGPFTLVHFVPPRDLSPTTTVSAVYPSANVLPENLLKFYLHFSAPMSRGGIYEHIKLLDSAGKPVDLPFLEIDEELWNPDRTRLTLFIDPGRIKRGVKPLEDIGPALAEGRFFTLVIAATWKDAAGAPLKEEFRKAFRVGPQDREPPDPAKWSLAPPAAGTREPLVVGFNKPMDHALASRMLRVTSPGGRAVEGDVVLSDFERRWSFTPDEPWAAGPHQLVVQTTIEDLAGNNIGKPFEVDQFERVERRLTTSSVSRAFEIR